MSVFGVGKVRAQSITPAQDGTGTNVTTNGNQYDIDGGSLSGDGANLFHSFEQFGLSEGEMANFSSNPNLVNILGRIRGGDPSMINGLIQVTGGDSHLFLMNPAGFVFGNSAALDVPGNFTVTTANGIQFGSGWFSATGANDYQGLVGNPTGFGFTMAQPGAIVNEGNLAVGAGRDLSLVGGAVVNTGELQAPGGGVVVSAVPGENLVRLSIPGNVLSLEVEPLGESQPNGWNLPITALPDLLTVGASGVQGNSDGTVQVAGVQVPGDAGTAIVSGEVDVSGEMGGKVGVFGEKVAVAGAEIDASGVKGGGKVLIGGDYKGEGIVPNAKRTLVDEGSVINADAGVNGDGGEVIVWADEVTGFDGSISARGGSDSGNGGFAEVSGKENLSFNGTADLGAANGNSGALLLDPENIVIVNGDGGADDGEVTGDSQILSGDSPGSTFTISENALEGLPADTDIILEATNDITINDLADNFLTFAPRFDNQIRRINFRADADRNGIGSFSMNLEDTIQAERGSVDIEGNSLTVGKLDAFLIFVDTSGLLNVQAPIEATSLNLTADEINILEGAPIEASSIDLRADEINLLGGTGSVVTDSISLESRFNQNVIIGGNVDSGSETLDITTDDLDAITPLFPLDENTLPELEVVSGFISGIITVQGSLKADRIEFTADEIDLLGGAGSVVTNFISLKPNFDQNIIVGGSGDSGAENLDITTDDLAALTPLNRNSLPSISIGGFGGHTLTVQTPIEASSIDFRADEINLLEGASLEATLIYLTADEINLLGGAGSVVTNSISFRNLNTDSNIIVGGNADSGSETLNITTDDLEALAPVDGNTLPGIFVGSFGTLTVQSPIEASDIFLSAADEIDLLAGSSLEASDIFLSADEINLLAGSSLEASDIRLRADEIDFLGGAGSVVTNSISLESQFNQNVILGGNADSGSETLDITTDDLNSITFQDDSPSIDISRANHITAVSGNTPLQFNASLSLNANTITVERIFDVDGDISFNSTGTTQINSTVQATSLTTNAGGETQLNSNIITTGTEGQNYNDNVRIDDNVTLDSNNNPINFNGTVNSQTGETNNLTANAGTGNITVNSQVGNTQPLGNLEFNTTGNTQINSTLQAASLTTNAGGETQLNGNVTTTGTEGQNYNDNVRIDNNVTLNSNNNPITVNGTVNSQTGKTNDLTANAGTGNITVNSQVGNTQPLGNLQVNSTGTTRLNSTVQAASLTTNAGGEIQINGNVTTTNSQTYGDILTIISDTTLTGNKLNFADNVSGSGHDLILQPSSSNQNIQIGSLTDISDTNTLDITDAELNLLQNGFNSVTIGRTDSTGTITIDATGVNFNDPLNLRSPNSGGAIVANGQIQTNGNPLTLSAGSTVDVNANITTTGGDININSSGIIDTTGATLNASSSSNGGVINLTATNNSTIGDITTRNNNVNLNSPVTLNNDTSINVDGMGGDVNFNNTVNGNQNLTVNSGSGDTNFNSPVGNTQPIGNLQVNSTGTTRLNSTVQSASLTTNAGGETQLNGNVTTTGINGQNYGNNVRIDDNLTLDSNDNPIDINGTVNSQSGETNSLTINSGNSNTSLNADVGNTSPLGDVNINSTNDINTQNLTANTINLTSENNVNTGNLNTSSTTENGGDISLEGTTVTTGNLNSSGINGGNISIEATTSIETGTINSSGTSGNGGDVTLDPENDIEVSSINAQGGENGVGGDVDITTEQNLRATGTFTDQNGTNASISTAGGEEGGSVIIRHGGGSQNTPFVVGDATTNGTAAAITTGTNNTIAPVQSFPGSYTQGTPPNQIQIITEEQPSNFDKPEDLQKLPDELSQIEPQRPVETIVYEIEDRFTTQANQYLGETTTTPIKTLDEIRQDLRRIVETTKGEVKPGIIYVSFLPRGPVVRPELDGNKIPPISDIALEVPLELMLVTSEGDVITKSMFEATRTKVFSQANNFLSSVDSRSKEGTEDYKEPAEQFYEWLIRPIEEELKAQGINNLVFVMDEGLRSLPLAALRDRQDNKFIIEKGYSIGLTPSMSLINIREADTINTLQNARVLAMGASEFKSLPPLPGVETEIELILNLWQGDPFPNEEFTKDNLKSAQDTGYYKIVHLATHANFEPSPLSHSFIQFGDGVVGLDDIKTLGLDDPLVELLVLSACKTASGNKDAELGFAGIARLTGVKSVLGSLWKINDIGNLGLMTEFYTQLKTAPTKAEALRQAQVAMLKGNVKFENGDLVGEQYRISLPEELNVDNRTLSHPYYWSGFTMIGNPW